MKFLELTNFEETQHYKDRTPPWIKLHRELLNKREFLKLTEQERYHYVGFQVLASESHNRIPLDDEWIKQRFHITGKPAYQAIVKAGLARIVSDGPATSASSSAPQVNVSTPEECFNSVVEHYDKYSNEGVGSGWKYQTPDLPSQLEACVRHIGGWPRISNLRKKPTDLPFARREFIEAMKGSKK